MQSESLFQHLWTAVGQRVTEEHRLNPAEVAAAKDRMKQPFRDGHKPREFMDIDFNNVLNCVAYALRVATCHSLLVEAACERLFRHLPRGLLDSWLAQPCVKVASVGGGPGSDLLGFHHVLHQEWMRVGSPEFILQVRGAIIDYFARWDVVVDKLRHVVCQDTFSQLNKNAILDIDFYQMDLSDAVTNASDDLNALMEADVILMVKVLSIMPCRQRISLLKNVLGCMKPGSVLIFVDTYTDLVKETLERWDRGTVWKVVLGPTEQETISTDLPWQDFMVASSYRLCVIQRERSRA